MIWPEITIKLPAWDLSTVSTLPEELIPWLEKNGSSKEAFENERERVVALVETLAQREVLTRKQAFEIEQLAGGMFSSKFTLSNGSKSKQISTFFLKTLSKKNPFFRPLISGSFKESQEKTLHIEASDAAFEAFITYLITKKIDSVIDPSNLNESLLSEFEYLLDFYDINEKQKIYFILTVEFINAVKENDLDEMQDCFSRYKKLKSRTFSIEFRKLNELNIKWPHYIGSTPIPSLIPFWISHLASVCSSSKKPLEIDLTLGEVCDTPWREPGKNGTPPHLFKKRLNDLHYLIQKIGPYVTKLDMRGFRSDSILIFKKEEHANVVFSKWGKYFKSLKNLYTRNLPKFDEFVSDCNFGIETIEINEPFTDELEAILIRNPRVRIKTHFKYFFPLGFRELKSKYPGRLE